MVLDRLPTPMLVAPRGQIERLDLPHRSGFLRPRRSQLDPLRQRGNLFCGELRLRRHLVDITVVDHRHQQTLGRFTGDDRRPRVAPLEQLGPRIHSQSPLRSLVATAVTFEAPGRQDRPHFLLEELDGCFVEGWHNRRGISGDTDGSREQAQQTEAAHAEKACRWRSGSRQHRGLRRMVAGWDGRWEGSRSWGRISNAFGCR